MGVTLEVLFILSDGSLGLGADEEGMRTSKRGQLPAVHVDPKLAVLPRELLLSLLVMKAK